MKRRAASRITAPTPPPTAAPILLRLPLTRGLEFEVLGSYRKTIIIINIITIDIYLFYYSLHILILFFAVYK